jgi:hypothetical protein
MLNYPRADLVLLGLSVVSPELSRYNVEFGVHRTYSPLAETPAVLSVETRHTLRTARKEGRRGGLYARIEDYLKSKGPSDVTTLRAAFPDVEEQKLRSAVYVLSKQGRLDRTPAGEYQLHS